MGLLLLFLLGVLLAATLYLTGLLRHLRHPPRRSLGWALARGVPGDPEALGVAWREDEVPAGVAAGHGAAPLAFWRIARDAAALDAPTRVVILLHGWGHGRRDTLAWLGLDLAPWSEPGTLLVLPDLRGHGDSPGRSGLGDLDRADLWALLATLPAAPFTLVGHSMGAVVAIETAAAVARDAERGFDLREVVAIAPYERLRVPVRSDLARRGYTVGPFLWPLLALLRIAGIRERSTAAAAAQLTVPLRVVHGAADPTCPAEDARAIAAAAPHSSFIVIEGAGHLDLWRSHREAMETAIGDGAAS